MSMIKRNSRPIFLLLIVFIIISFGSCNPAGKFERTERKKIQEYLGSHSELNFDLKPSGLYYLETVPGTGISPVAYDSAFVRYTGKLLDGYVFDSNISGALYGFIVGQNITGFDEGVTLMKVGGKSTLLIPSELAYGPMGSYPYISGYTPILFDIELIKVKRAVAK
jgi:FKBP-type peptidyl-prolyl cis-trans isomerase